uniref:Uncharacterized protein n=1 Tax=Picea glauca TaxID=3330 RepID=A0A117NII8_PICGL|nr:hypothetical protein ABT39_MTgene3258 [Picea glauca]QHR89241.1 hypothetical protein Q903MT_gene3261 [Picea sitchensis]
MSGLYVLIMPKLMLSLKLRYYHVSRFRMHLFLLYLELMPHSRYLLELFRMELELSQLDLLLCLYVELTQMLMLLVIGPTI